MDCGESGTQVKWRVSWKGEELGFQVVEGEGCGLPNYRAWIMRTESKGC